MRIVKTLGVLGVTPSAGLMVLFSGWWKQWGIAPPAHLTEGSNPLSGAPPQATNTHAKLELIKPNI